MQNSTAVPLDLGVAHCAHLQALSRSSSMRFNVMSRNCCSPRLTLHGHDYTPTAWARHPAPLDKCHGLCSLPLV